MKEPDVLIAGVITTYLLCAYPSFTVYLNLTKSFTQEHEYCTDIDELQGFLLLLLNDIEKWKVDISIFVFAFSTINKGKLKM